MRTYNATDRGTDLHHNMDVVVGYKGEYSAQLFVQQATNVVNDHIKRKEDKVETSFGEFFSVMNTYQTPVKSLMVKMQS